MIRPPKKYELYAPAMDRFFKPAIANFFKKQFPDYFGSLVIDKIADEIIRIFEQLHPQKDYLNPGQIFWNALDKNTRADSKNRRYKPVVLTIINQEDVRQIANGTSIPTVARAAIARMFREAYDQGGILSTRDISLLTLRSDSHASTMRIKYEKEHQIVLPHTGVLHDMGPSITHKGIIIRKIILDKKDPARVALETKHTQKAVDHYYQNYNRVITVYQNNSDVNYIHFVTKISRNVIKQYINIYLQCKKLL